MYNKKYSYTRFKKYPFYELNDGGLYSHFMLELLGSLETRVFKPKKILLNELEMADEFYFVQKGKWDVGYNINNIRKFRM